ncbi:ECF-type sigma factor [Thalassoroseus pseudoceratinae]|uniref:ECF-type sigma factor n=1 Tax=Thalassoroseus pseudoceratinae TaxID=2713176 RepID=UPI00142431E2|nr:ECF-type sigma factor [Thalassoroseus pseudoceratinae]
MAHTRGLANGELPRHGNWDKLRFSCGLLVSLANRRDATRQNSWENPHKFRATAEARPAVNAEETVTMWIAQLRQGDEAAAQQLWEQYFGRMVRLARRRLETARRTAADEEDVALSAFKSFCMGVQAGRFPQLTDRDSLWPLLVAITANKSVDLIRHENRQKRRQPTSPQADSHERESISQILSREPTPDLAGEIAELFERLMNKLDSADDPDLKLIAIRRMQGDSAAEIANDLGCVKRTIERKVTLIRRLWEEESR